MGKRPRIRLAKKGVLCLQDHGYPASFRNIKIKELPRKTKEVTLFNGTDLKGWEAYGTEKWYVEDGLLICETVRTRNTAIWLHAITMTTST